MNVALEPQSRGSEVAEGREAETLWGIACSNWEVTRPLQKEKMIKRMKWWCATAVVSVMSEGD